MNCELSEINTRARLDPAAFTEESDAAFHRKVVDAAVRIRDNISKSRIVLLSGPSGSGKSTTAAKISGVLGNMGIRTHTVAMDDYFVTVDPETAPRNAQGDLDFESPRCVDFELMDQHFSMLERGEEILVPHFSFTHQRRLPSRARPLRLGQGDVAIFEGIHALRDSLTERHSSSIKLYISARSDFYDGGEPVILRSWLRLVRRCVRDCNFRGSPVRTTLKMWANVREGEKKYITPFREKADIIFDSSLPYEVCVMRNVAIPLFSDVPKDNPRYSDLVRIMEGLRRFEPIDPSHVRPDSLLREFIGGGIYGQH